MTKIPCRDIMALAVAIDEKFGFMPLTAKVIDRHPNAQLITEALGKGDFSLVTDEHRVRADEVILHFKGKIVDVMTNKKHAFTNAAVAFVSKESFAVEEVEVAAKVIAALPRQFNRSEEMEQSTALIEQFSPTSKPIGRYGAKFEGTATVLRAVNSGAYDKWFLTCNVLGGIIKFSQARADKQFKIGDELAISGTVYEHDFRGDGGCVTRLIRVVLK